MPEYQQAVIKEHDELRVKLNRLCVFIEEGAVFATLHPAEQGRLLFQRSLMRAYADVLTERIARFVP